MLKLTGSVGASGVNKLHDVALVQAALSFVTARDDRGRMAPLWGGRVDGRKSAALTDAITRFQTNAKQKVTGRLEMGGPGLAKLNAALPSKAKDARSISGTSLVYRVGDAVTQPWKQLARDTEKSAPYPEAERKALATFQKEVGSYFGFCLAIRESSVTQDGRFAANMQCEGVEWLDARGNFAKSASLPGPLRMQFARELKSGGKWQLGQGSPGSLTFCTNLKLASLNGPPKCKQADLDLFGIKSQPPTLIAGTLIAGAANLVATDASGSAIAATQAGKGQFTAITSALQAAAPAAAKKVAFPPPPRVKPTPPPAATAPHVRGLIAWPTDHLVVTSVFNATAGRSTPHNGADIRAFLGESVYAVEDGTVFGVGRSGAINEMFIAYDSGSEGGYAHVRAVVSAGQKVVAGQRVAVSDGSGTRHAHLHYTFRQTPAVPRIDPISNQLTGFGHNVKP